MSDISTLLKSKGRGTTSSMHQGGYSLFGRCSRLAKSDLAMLCASQGSFFLVSQQPSTRTGTKDDVRNCRATLVASHQLQVEVASNSFKCVPKCCGSVISECPSLSWPSSTASASTFPPRCARCSHLGKLLSCHALRRHQASKSPGSAFAKKTTCQYATSSPLTCGCAMARSNV